MLDKAEYLLPSHHHQKLINKDHEHKFCALSRMATEVTADALAEAWMGCVVQIMVGMTNTVFP